jgi:conjugal transfer/type IV secretion protein DotA/TraY
MFGMKLMQYSENCWVDIIMNSFLSSNIDIFTQRGNISSLNLLIAVMPVILIFAGIFWLLGATFAIYTPMIPYMMFTITALSWFLLVIEAIVAAPIVALGLIVPSQDELGKVVPALGIITNGFLKPSLMVIGLIAAAKIYAVVVGMVNMGFKFSFAALQSKTGTSMFSWIVMLILYSGFIVTLVNKCYGLIYALPDKVLRWIGVTGEQTDISSIKETQQQFDQHSKQGIGVVEGQATSAAEKFKENVQAATKKDGSALHQHGGGS